MNCRKCGIKFPSWMTLDGISRNLGSRKYCLSCSPFKANNRRNFEKTKLNSEGTRRSCSNCLKDFIFRRQRAMTLNLCSGCVSKKRRRIIKEKAVDYKGGKCQNCGYNKCINALDFHHIDPREKDFTISGNAGKWEKIKNELDKCVLLCKNCHSEVHFL